MHKLYILSSFLFLVLFCGCSKDILKRYQDRVIGTWHVSNINKFGFGGDINSLPFPEGSLTFNEDGSLVYVNSSNETYQGKWEIVKKVLNDQTIHSLQLTAVNYTTQEVLAEYYDDMNFRSTNHFTANIVSTFHTYITHFKR